MIDTLYIIPIAIFIIYIIAVAYIIFKKNEKHKPKTRLIECNVCGNMIEENVEVCPYCHTIRKKLNLKLNV